MAKRKEKTLEPCPYCGKAADRVLECPDCAREGCDECMPAGVGVPCPECEEKEE